MRKSRTLEAIVRKAYWREDDARFVVDGWRESGHTLTEFARLCGVDRRRLLRWADRIGDGVHPGGSLPETTFHPVRVVGGRTAGRDEAVCELDLGNGVIVRVPEGYDLEHLRGVLAVLEAKA